MKPKKLSLKRAIRILVQAAARDVMGQGCGIRSTSEKQRKETIEAIERVSKFTEGRELWDTERFNLGLPQRGE